MNTTLTIRNLDEGVKHRLRQLAALHQRSMEAEAREILARGVSEFAPGKPMLSSSERMREGIQTVRGLWKGTGTTDELMKELRGDE
ncbi:hypothetical protein BH09VER1_BH09VER1_00510 [soil metagenome]